MDAYTSFAQVYDDFMDNIPYSEWCEYLKDILKKYNVENGIILDLGCGTGSITQCLAAADYDMIGVDNSIDMLEIAKEKSINANQDILYLFQDMREFELYGTVAAAVSICDSLNYIMEKEELLEVFRLVNNYLDPKGVFIFDLNTVYKYENVLSDNTIAEDRDNMSFIWDNYYYKEEQVNEYNLSLFIKEEETLYRKYTETHYQRAYSLDTIKELIDQAGLEFVDAFDAFTFEAPKEKSERIYVVAREMGK